METRNSAEVRGKDRWQGVRGLKIGFKVDIR